MADYEIILRAEDAEGNSAVAGANEQTGGGGGKKTYGEKTAASLEKGVKGLIAYSSIKGTAEQLVTAEIGRVELRTGASEYQARLQRTYSIVSSVVNAGMAVGVGVATGNLPLALISVATQGIQWFIQGFQKQTNLSLAATLQNISIDMATRRASTDGRRQ